MKIARRLVAALFVAALGIGSVAATSTPANAADTTWGTSISKRGDTTWGV